MNYNLVIKLIFLFKTTISAQFVRMDVTIRIHAHAKRIFRNLPYIDRQNKTKSERDLDSRENHARRITSEYAPGSDRRIISYTISHYLF